MSVGIRSRMFVFRMGNFQRKIFEKILKMRENDNRIGQLFILEHLRLQPLVT